MTDRYKLSRYAMAVLLISSSIAMAAYQVFDIESVAHGTLIYIAQAFMLAGAIFGLDAYVKRLENILGKNQDRPGSNVGTKNVDGMVRE